MVECPWHPKVHRRLTEIRRTAVPGMLRKKKTLQYSISTEKSWAWWCIPNISARSIK
jgi:hypothetical protein